MQDTINLGFTPLFTAPEMLNNGNYYLDRVDVWSLGIIFYLMVVGSPPLSLKLNNTYE